MLRETADRDLREIRRRIERQTDWIEQLRSVGQVSRFAEAELAELKSELRHIEHHRAILEYSLRDLEHLLVEEGA